MQNDIAKKQYHSLKKVPRFEKEYDDIINKKPTLKKYKESHLIYNNNYSFYKYHDINKFNKLSLESKQ